MKIKLLFVIDSLNVAGAEKSLVTLLSLLNFKKYEVDLMLFGHGGELEKIIPKEINILPPLQFITFSKLNMRKALSTALKSLKFYMLFSRIKYSLTIRTKNYNNKQKARIFWQSVSRVIERNPKDYDIAISYAQGVPTFYVAEKVKAKKKFAWVNVSYRLEGKDKAFQEPYYRQYDRIVAVSDSTKAVFSETFPQFEERIRVIYDINDPALISSMAELGNGYNDSFDGIRILTIGRLNHQKGYDIALAACKRLKEAGVNFKWYVLGKGPLRQEIEAYIREHGLSEHFILLGVDPNPYSFIKQSDLYVQTSKFEGFGIAIAEARMLNVPVVTTRFDAVYNQMVHGKNGLVVDMNEQAVYEGIMNVIQDDALRNNITTYLKNEKKGNVDELERFYELIG